MSSNEVAIKYGRILRIPTVEHFCAVAANLAMDNCAYLVGEVVRSGGRQIIEQRRQIGLLVSSLCDFSGIGIWFSSPDSELYTNPTLDIGLHGLTYAPQQGSENLVRWHHNTSGTFEVTTAEVGPAYLSDSETNLRLASLLRRNMTDPELADPATFKRATVRPNESIVFRLNKGGSDGTPLLIDFRTTSPTRSANIYNIFPFTGSTGLVTF